MINYLLSETISCPKGIAMTLAQENSILSLIGTDPDGLLPIEIQKLKFVAVWRFMSDAIFNGEAHV